MMERPLLTARLTTKRCLCARTQTYHLEFNLPEVEQFDFTPGQFISIVAERTRPDGQVKQDTRAYSLASAPRANSFDLCVNRIDAAAHEPELGQEPGQTSGAGYFSNLLCDLKTGDAIELHGPHGNFVLRQPLTDSILIASHTGIAPIRAMLQHALASDVSASEVMEGGRIFLVQEVPGQAETLYAPEFEELQRAAATAFRYRPIRDEGEGHARLLECVGALLAKEPEIRTAYICGLNAMVAPVRAALKELGWDRKQIVFERYD